MEPAASYDAVVHVASRSRDAASGWRDLIGLIAREAGPGLAALMQEVDVLADIASVSAQLVRVFQSEPPAANIDTLYFGLFDTMDEEGSEGIGYYVAGIRGFDPNVTDSLCNPEWWPDGRYLESRSLNAVKSAELGARAAGNSVAASFLGYAGQLGAGLVVSRFAVSPLDLKRRVVVGFDAGDYSEIGV